MSDTDGIDRALLKALGHPLRAQILQILWAGVASPNEISKHLDEPLGNVSYHVKVLKKAGAVEEVRSEPRRGAVEHYYKATPQSFQAAKSWEEVPPAIRQSLAGASFDTLVPQVVAALEANTFEARDNSSISWLPLSVDELGWDELVEILESVDSQVKAVGKKCRRRLRGQNGISVVTISGAFEIARRKNNQ